MSRFAAKPAASSYPPLCMVEKANRSFPTGNGGCELRALRGGLDRSNAAAMAANFIDQRVDENFAPACVYRSVSRRMLGHGFGAIHAPGGSSLFCFGSPPHHATIACRGPRIFAALRVTVSLQILFGKYTEKISPDPP